MNTFVVLVKTTALAFFSLPKQIVCGFQGLFPLPVVHAGVEHHALLLQLHHHVQGEGQHPLLFPTPPRHVALHGAHAAGTRQTQRSVHSASTQKVSAFCFHWKVSAFCFHWKVSTFCIHSKGQYVLHPLCCHSKGSGFCISSQKSVGFCSSFTGSRWNEKNFEEGWLLAF